MKPEPSFSADARVRQLFAATPFVQHLGVQVTAVRSGVCETQLSVAPHHLQQHGCVHAGVLATLADHTAGGAACSVAPAEVGVLSIEFKINMLRKAYGPLLRCAATVLKAGRNITVVEAEVWSAEKLVCKSTVTLAMVREASP